MECIATIGFVFADRFANVFVSMNTLGVIIAITHIAGYIATRRGKNRRLVASVKDDVRRNIIMCGYLYICAIFDMDSLSLCHPIRCADNKEL